MKGFYGFAAVDKSILERLLAAKIKSENRSTNVRHICSTFGHILAQFGEHFGSVVGSKIGLKSRSGKRNRPEGSRGAWGPPWGGCARHGGGARDLGTPPLCSFMSHRGSGLPVGALGALHFWILQLWWSKLASGELQEDPESVQRGPWSAQGCHLATFWSRLGTKMKPKLMQEGCMTFSSLLAPLCLQKPSYRLRGVLKIAQVSFSSLGSVSSRFGHNFEPSWLHFRGQTRSKIYPAFRVGPGHHGNLPGSPTGAPKRGGHHPLGSGLPVGALGAPV